MIVILVDLFFSIFFLFHISLLYYSYFRILKFLISIEISLILVFFVVGFIVLKYDIVFLLFYLSIMACESSIGLGLLVSFIRFNDKSNVKSNIFNSF